MSKTYLLLSIILLTIFFVSCEEDDNEPLPPYNNTECSLAFIEQRDGKEYNCVIIGDQIWMAENLAYRVDTGGCWSYNDNDDNVAVYGYLYNWYTANLVAPDGWHLPSDDEWKTLELNLYLNQYIVDTVGWRGANEGGKLKGTSTEYWQAPNTDATILQLLKPCQQEIG